MHRNKLRNSQEVNSVTCRVPRPIICIPSRIILLSFEGVESGKETLKNLGRGRKVKTLPSTERESISNLSFSHWFIDWVQFLAKILKKVTFSDLFLENMTFVTCHEKVTKSLKSDEVTYLMYLEFSTWIASRLSLSHSLEWEEGIS